MIDPGVRAWPFVGRSDELALARAALDERCGVVVFGASGVGKSRFAHEVIAAAGDGERWHRVTGARGTERASFGAWSHLLPDRTGAAPDGSSSTARTDASAWRALADHLRGADGTIRLHVDDVQWLDGDSAAFVHQLVATGQARVVLTGRRDAPPAQPITALWKDGHLERIDLERLAQADVGRILEAALGAPIEPRTVASLHDRTRGDLLLVRELVADGTQRGTLRLVHGAWVEVAASAPSPRVIDLLADRVDALAPDERAAAELVAVATPVPAELLARMVESPVVDRLVDHGLVRFDGPRERRQVSFVDPLLAEVLIERQAVHRHDEVLHALVGHYGRAEALHDDDALRLEVWRLDLGSSVEPGAALRAADLASARSDFATAERLAAAAVDAGGGLPATIRLGEALMQQQRHAAADEVLRPVADHILELDDGLRYRYANARALALGTDLGRLDEAISVLEATIATMPDDRSRWALEAHLSFRLVDCGHLIAAEPLAEARLANVADDEPSALTALVAGCLIRTDSGRCLDTLELCDAMTPVALRHVDDRPEALAWIAAAQMLARYTRGDFDASLELIGAMEQFVADDPDPTVHAGLLMSRGLVLSEQGKLDSALRLLQQATALHEVDNRRGYQTWCFAITSRIHAMRGELADAERLLATARRHLWPGGQSFAYDVEVAAIWVATLGGDRAGATRILGDALASMEREGRAAVALRLRHEAIRAGLPVEPHVDAFARTTVVEQSRWAQAHVGYVAALAADDGAGLAAAGAAYAGLGLALPAAEAYAQAAGAHRRAGSSVLAAQAKQLSEGQRARCEAAATPALRFGELVVGLTDRELDVTTRAAAGQANQQIAAALGISVRTAETHLQRAFAKLGIHRRGDLASLFDVRELASPAEVTT